MSGERDGTLTSHYEIELPLDRIPQRPTETRGESRLLIVNRATGDTAHKHFSDLPGIIPPRDVLVLNPTEVFRAPLLGVRENGPEPGVCAPRPLRASTLAAT